jgi:hypothetical protein
MFKYEYQGSLCCPIKCIMNATVRIERDGKRKQGAVNSVMLRVKGWYVHSSNIDSKRIGTDATISRRINEQIYSALEYTKSNRCIYGKDERSGMIWGGYALGAVI